MVRLKSALTVHGGLFVLIVGAIVKRLWSAGSQDSQNTVSLIRNPKAWFRVMKSQLCSLCQYIITPCLIHYVLVFQLAHMSFLLDRGTIRWPRVVICIIDQFRIITKSICCTCISNHFLMKYLLFYSFYRCCSWY